ncbi:hypothetical protein [Spiroplasma endosymbiont of Eupeodes luniger]|uniref:hypothetical protein n=1 Tax=Spiroplasma endosymbiont of Eupeodes luniger TaxID=3066300 RepID=UPI0030CA9B66
MLDILQAAEIEKFKKGGKTNKLSLENRLDFLHNLLKKLQIFVIFLIGYARSLIT